MFKKLRFKFILITMISLAVVLGGIITAINVVNYSRVSLYADDVLQNLADNGGSFDKPDYRGPESGDFAEPPEKPSEEPRPDGGKRRGDFFSAETPYETRYFSVKTVNGNYEADVENVIAIDETEAISLAEEVIKSGKKKGYKSIYRYLADDDMVIFMDCRMQLNTAKNFLLASIAISLSGFLLVFISVFALSKRVIKPITESYARQKRFITDAEHELKTPLTIISANNELTEIISGETENTQAISKQVAKMTNMVKNMISLARLDEKDGELKTTEFSLSDAVVDTEELFRSAIETNGKRADFRHEESISYKGDEQLVRQFLSILFDNAAKYSDTYVETRLYREGRSTVFIIKNDAEGVAAGNKDRCFDRFYRSEEARGSNKEGSGIGLSIAKDIADLHKISVHAYSEKDGEFAVKAVF